MRVVARGKSFVAGGAPFRFRGVAYSPGAAPGDPRRLRERLAAIARLGYTVVAMPPPRGSDVEETAASGLGVMLEIDGRDLTFPVSASRRERSAFMRELAACAKRAVRAWDRSEALVGVAVGPPGRTSSVELGHGAADRVAMAVHDEDESLIAGWRTGWPLQADCPPECDFLLVDVEPSAWVELGPALFACHSAVGDRPLVVGGTLTTASLVEAALRCGAAGSVARPPSQAEAEPDTARLNRLTVRDLEVAWPSISVVINAYNAATTLEECLNRCDRLDYPGIEVIVVDDGSTDATAAIAQAHSHVRLVATPHCGLSAARNVGYRSARGDVIAYLDADAYPSFEWPWYLALAVLGDRVAGAGGPNVPPPDDPVSARVVARSPGGPVPQLLAPDRAAHLPGCNMAFRREVLEALGGFDPVLEGAEDVEFQWRVVESGRDLAYHPAALVWHHRRAGVGHYLRQQRHYGRSQAILERRCPERFPPGYRLKHAAARLRPRGGGAADSANDVPWPVHCLSLPPDDSAAWALAHQWGVPLAVGLAATAPVGLARRRLGIPALAGATYIGALFAADVRAAARGSRRSERSLAFRSRLASLRLLRPLAFRWGHATGWWEFRRPSRDWPP